MINKLLCIGNNSIDTDVQARQLAIKHGLDYQGLLSDLESPISYCSYQLPGVYHTSIFDLEFGKLVGVANDFDLVAVLDQPKDQWTHPDAFYNTMRAAKLVTARCEFLGGAYQQDMFEVQELVTHNKSFCVFPFIEMLVNYDYTTVCCRSQKPVAQYQQDLDFKNHPEYQSIRKAMIAGEILPDHCSSCYELEKQGIISARQQETVEWFNRLDVKQIADLEHIQSPVYYEIRASNKCNLMCRMCKPSDSHLIADEYQRLGLFDSQGSTQSKNSHGFDIIKFDSLRKVYIAGGEPTIMPELYDFLDRCINENRSDVEILINTNGTKLSERFKKQILKLPNLHFIISIDGFASVNDYVRWNSHWDTLVSNWHWLTDHGKSVTINSTFSIWNIGRMHELYEFIDANFKITAVHAQLAVGLDCFHVRNYPDKEKAIQSLKRVADTRCYRNDPTFASFIDGLYTAFQTSTSPLNTQNLKDFFKFNDQLDRSRGVNLADYLPELDFYRKFV
jgi:hypothetical protein